MPTILNKYRNQRILITPLNWGLGHASRCVPLIDQLLKQNSVFVASDGLALEWIRREYPTLTVFELPPLDVNYNHHQMWLNGIVQLKRIHQSIKSDKEAISKLVKDHSIDVIISDHRLGCYSHHTRNILLVHQLYIPHKKESIAHLASRVQRRYVKEFDQCWIPDFQDARLSGSMSSYRIGIQKCYIGPLSRFKKSTRPNTIYDIGMIISGPEPQRTLFEKSLLDVVRSMSDLRFIMVRGTNRSMTLDKCPPNLVVRNLANSPELNEIIGSSNIIVCRSGYSSIMDLYHLDKQAFLVPTPNLPEQEYLGELHSESKQFTCMQQSDISIESFRDQLVQLKGASK